MRLETTPEGPIEEQQPFSFPRDHGAHARHVEWWYVNGNLVADGSFDSIWFTVAFFKLRLGWPGFLSRLRSTSDFLYGYQVHASIYHEATGEFKSETKNSVYLPYRVLFQRDDLAIRVRGNALERIAPHQFRLRSAFSCLGLDLIMTSSTPPMIHGVDGVIQMGGKGESKYYSLSSLDAEGQILCAGKSPTVRGRTWFDHQWGSWQDNCVFWQWFCVRLSNRTQIMIYAFENECDARYKSAITLQEVNGRCFYSQQLERRTLDHYTSEASRISYPTSHEFRFEINHRRYILMVKALHKQQEIHSRYVDYWEGPCRVTGTVDGTTLEGTAFCEIIGRYVYGSAIQGI